MAIPLITFMFVPVQIFGSSESMCWCFAPIMGSGPQSACGYASSIADLFSMFFRSLFACVCVCLCNICIDVKPNLFYFFSLLLAGGHSISLGLCPTKLPVKRDIQLGQLDVPAIFRCNFDWHGTRPSLEPHSCIFTSRLSQSGITVGHLRLVQLHQNLPQSKDVENILGTICLHVRRQHRRRQLFIG